MVECNNDWSVIHDNSIEMYSDFRLVENNSILSLANKKKIYLFHCTDSTNYKKIIEEKQLLSSGGCLVASIYCTLALKISEDKFRLHNLGGYYYFRELPFANNNTQNQIKGLLIEIIHNKPYEIIGVNYLHINSITTSLFLKHKNSITQDLYSKITQKIIYSLKILEPFLFTVKLLYQKELSYKAALNFINELNSMAEYLPKLGHFMFEAISKYIMLNQDDPISNSYRKLNEIYNWNYKNMFFSMYPQLHIKFDLGIIRFKKDDYINYIKDHFLIKNFSEEHFINVVVMDIINMIYEYLIRNIHHDDFNSLDESIFDNPSFSSICGCLLHEKLKEKGYEKLLLQIENDKATDIWKYWNNNNISILYNNIIAKGELGLNPYRCNEYQYNIYDCDAFFDIKEQISYLQKGEKLNVEIASDIMPYSKSKNRG